MKLRLAFRIGRWLALTSFLAGLGVSLYFLVPPRPRWTVDVAGLQWDSLHDGRFLLVRTQADRWELRETRDGAVVFSCSALAGEGTQEAEFDGRWLILPGAENCRLIDTATGQERKLQVVIADRKSDFAEFGAFSPDYRYFLSQAEFTVSIIDTDTGNELRRTHANVRSGKNSLMGFTADKRCYYVADSEKLINGFPWPGLHTFDPVSGRETLVLEDVPSGLRSADGKLGLITHSDDNKNYLWDLTTLKKLREVESMEDYAANAMFSPDGKILVSWHDAREGEIARQEKKDEESPPAVEQKPPEIRKQMDDDEAMRRWAARVRLMKFWDVATGRLLSQSDIPTPFLPNESSSFGEFSPDGKTFLFCNVAQKTVALWDIAKGKEIWQHSIPSSKVRNTMTFSDDGRFLVWCGHEDMVGNKLVWGGIEVFDAATGESAWKRPEATLAPMGLWQGSRFARGNRVLYYQYRTTPYPLNHVRSWFNGVAGRGRFGDYDLVVCDLASGVPVTRLGDCGYGTLSEEGQRIQAVEYTPTVNGPKLLYVTCWDLPPPRRWEIILGGPAIVGLLAVGWRRWRRKVVAARSAPSVQPAASA